jgi:hypothetical protein
MAQSFAHMLNRRPNEAGEIFGSSPHSTDNNAIIDATKLERVELKMSLTPCKHNRHTRRFIVAKVFVQVT